MSHRDRIWLTAHIRMSSERRLRNTSRTLSYLTVWYSTVLTCLTVYQLIADKNVFRDVTSAALAVALLALSTFVPSLNLEQQADKYRDCYLKLQRLLDTIDSDKELTLAYYDILDAYPNHPPSDYYDFVVKSWLIGQKINSSGNAILPTYSMHGGYWLRRIGKSFATAVAGLAPCSLYYLL